MNTSILFEITIILMGLCFTAYLMYFRFSATQLRKYQRLTGTNDETAYLKMFSTLKLFVCAAATALLMIDLVFRLGRMDEVDTGAIVFFTGMVIAIGTATFVSVYYRLSKEKRNSKK